MARFSFALVLLTLIACSDRDPRCVPLPENPDGCRRAIGLGDSCMVEATPEGGFLASETYLETSSVWCRTRVCMIYNLGGDPSQSREECLAAAESFIDCDNHPTEVDLAERVHCTCRCALPGAATDGTCQCGEGFTCAEVLSQEGSAVHGSYCVHSEVAPGG